jgi:hypothetical protein
MSLLDTASLIVTPNGYKEGKLYSVIPSDGSGDLSVTRATTATRVNSAGLVELVPYNLWLYSQEFDNSEWLKTECTITANAIAAPNGTLTAEKITDTTANNEHRFRATSGLFTIAGATTFSIYAKAAEYTKFAIANLSDGYNVIFNLSTGVIDSVGTDWTNAQITSVGDGWYRLSATISVNKTIGYGLVNGSGNFVFTGTGTSGVYIWGAQAVEGSTAKDYQKTETRLNIPRLDYSNGTCPSLLVEPQRTNLLTYSSSFDNAAWTKVQTTTSANVAVSPSGIQDADKLIPNTTSNIHYTFQSISDTIAAWTFSIYAKADGYNRIILNAYNTNFVGFNLTTGTIESTLGIGVTSANIEDAGNGWYRCSITSTSTSSGVAMTMSVFNSAYTNGNVNPIFSGNGTDGVLVWGAQFESGSYPTSYIPTTSASVTRNADVISKTGISSLIGQTEGTLYVDVDFKINSGEVGIFTEVTNGTSGQRVLIYYIGADILCYANTGVFSFTQPSNGRLKIAFGYKSGSSVLYINGVLINSSTASLSYSSLSQFNLGCNYQYGQVTSQPYNAAALWKTRLTNTQLAQLTTI